MFEWLTMEARTHIMLRKAKEAKEAKHLAQEVLVGWLAQEAGTHSTASS